MQQQKFPGRRISTKPAFSWAVFYTGNFRTTTAAKQRHTAIGKVFAASQQSIIFVKNYEKTKLIRKYSF